ncbi:hypothetical protein AVEN_100517-1 [Araneus ventricosus]|uniref:EF-hand domain-containing protein n=1 Tax=Araneus ventricosus TaxID=182803 RepID=A0A4Y2QRV8_ARAVE|nr:hypothetical protein AVEN_100517-1 [Araneus ventricosus]
MNEEQKEGAGQPAAGGKPSDSKDFSALFASFAKFGDDKGEGKISLKNIQKWFKQAGMQEMEACINDECVAYEYKNLFKDKTHITQTEFDSLLGAIAGSKHMDRKVLMDKLVEAGEPKISNVQDLISQVC